MPGGCQEKGNRKSEKGLLLPPTAKRIKNAPEVDEENRNGSSLSPMEKALQNSLVLQNIFKFLSYKYLQACQYVDLPFWYFEVQHGLSQRPLLIIMLERSDIAMTIKVEGKNTGFSSTNLVDLPVEFVKHGKGHAIRLTLKEFDATSEGFHKFVRKFGYAVSYLEFGRWSLGEMTLYDFQKLLSGFPNLSHLCMNTWIPLDRKLSKESVPKQKTSSSSSLSESCLLPQINTVSFGSFYDHRHPDLLTALFQMMPNLENILDLHLRFIPKSLSDDNLKLDKIKSVMFPRIPNRDDELTVAELSQLENASREIKLQVAYFPLNILPDKNSNGEQTSCFKSWSSVLKNNQDTLEYLMIEPAVSPELLEYPGMANVKKLGLYRPRSFFDTKPAKFFTQGFDVTRTFPNLTEVTLKSENCKLAEYVKFFPVDAFTGNYFRGVTCLNLQMGNFGELDSLEKVGRLFPDVTNFSMILNLGWLENRLDQILQLWPKLISLKLKVDVYKNCCAQREFCLDPVFTGISAGKCNELRKNVDKIDIGIEDYRQEFAISKMTDLKELTVIFGYWKSYVQPWTQFIPLFSHVTPFYGFQFVPDLKVTFAIPWDNKHNDKIRKMLSPVEKYVIFNPDYEEPQDYYPELPSFGYWF